MGLSREAEDLQIHRDQSSENHSMHQTIGQVSTQLLFNLGNFETESIVVN